MSKKKATGNTMTLKDFHGGSIPSDLPLPSAPGVIVRPSSDRSVYERSAPWGNQMGRTDNRPRPHTSPATRHFDDKTPFLTHSTHIGRNFDEDERKPLDGSSAPRRTISDESIRAPPNRAGPPKPESAAAGGSWGRQGLTPVLQVQSRNNSYSGRAIESGNVGQSVGGGNPNAWAARKEAVGVTEQLQTPWSAPMAVSKLAHASALEKVSSGRWQSRSSADYPTDADLVGSSEAESGLHSKGYDNNAYDSKDSVSDVQSYDNYAQGGRKELPDYERFKSHSNLDARERNFASYRDRSQPDRANDKFGGAEQTQTHSEPSERPKLKLLPRTKPLDSLEPPVVDYIQGYEQAIEVRAEHVNEGHGNLNPLKSGFAVSAESEKQAGERPKLNLKPRSQSVEQQEGNVESDRNVLFGGARPRELVLKERGIDDVGTNHDLVQHSERVEQHVPRADRISGHANSSRYNERTENPALDPRLGRRSERRDHEVRTENPSVDQRIGKKPERREHRADAERADTQRREHRADAERADTQRRNWRGNENRRQRETDKQPPQQQERAPSPETWRRPTEPPKPSSADSIGPRYGKAASAVELAASFSKSSVSDPTDRQSARRNLPGRPQPQIPFSRLTGPTPRPQINGY